MRMPEFELPEITLPAPDAVPPIVLLVAPPDRLIPLIAFGIAKLPPIPVPIKLPCTRLPVEPAPLMLIPELLLLPEIRFR